MTIPYPQPTTREQARANALRYAEDNEGGVSSRDRAKIWTMIATLFPETEGTGDDVLDQDEFASWTRHQIDKLSNILAETMTRVDRLEQSGRQVNNDSEIWAEYTTNLTQNEATNTEEHPDWDQVVADLRAGRVVTHTPDYIAELRKDAMSDGDKEDLRLMRSGQLALVHPDFLMEARAALMRMDLSVAEQETIRALRNHEAVVTLVPKSQRIAKKYGWDLNNPPAGWLSGPMKVESTPLDRAEERVRAHMGRNHFSQSTIDRVVEALRDEPTSE